MSLAQRTPRPGGMRPLWAAVFILVSLGAIVAIGWVSLVSRPSSLVSAAWWPSSGIAVGLAMRFPRRYVWPLAIVVGATTVPLALMIGRPVGFSVLVAAAIAAEVVVAVYILRGKSDRLPRLAAPADMGRFVIAIAVSAGVFDIVATIADLVYFDPSRALDRLVTALPKHAAGMMLIVPLYAGIQRRASRARLVEAVVQAVTTGVVVVSVFWLNPNLPYAFLPFLPLLWAAMRLGTRLLLVEMLAIAVIASFGSAVGRGPFSFDRLGPVAGSTVLQVFEISVVLVFLALSLSVGRERDTARRLHESEEFFRRTFDASVAGKLIVAGNADEWIVKRCNPSAKVILPLLAERTTPPPLSLLFDASQLAVFSERTAQLHEGGERFYLHTTDGRTLDTAVAAVGAGAGNRPSPSSSWMSLPC